MPEYIVRQEKLQQTTLIFFYFYLLKKIRLDVSCESSARQRIHMKYQVLFSLKNNEKVLMNVICCSRDWGFEGLKQKGMDSHEIWPPMHEPNLMSQ